MTTRVADPHRTGHRVAVNDKQRLARVRNGVHLVRHRADAFADLVGVCRPPLGYDEHDSADAARHMDVNNVVRTDRLLEVQLHGGQTGAQVEVCGHRPDPASHEARHAARHRLRMGGVGAEPREVRGRRHPTDFGGGRGHRKVCDQPVQVRVDASLPGQRGSVVKLAGGQPALRILLHQHVDDSFALFMAHAHEARVSHVPMVRGRPAR